MSGGAQAAGAVALLIPAYEPDPERFPALVRALRRAGFARLAVVDDGSATDGARAAFAAVRGAVDALLRHGTNRGKGAALRTGLAWIRDAWPDAPGVVTADADGQHLPDDIRAVADATARVTDRLVLGVRGFAGDVPLRSRFGNWWTRGLFRLLTGLSVRDTQTGLRGIPAALIPRALSIPGDRYEYEIRMLADARRHPAPPLQIPIQTVYLDNNAASHFRPFRDTLLTQRALWSTLFSS